MGLGYPALADIVNRITYRPGVGFQLIYDGTFAKFTIICRTNDANNRARRMTIHHENRFPIADMHTTEQFLQYVREQIRKMEMHEMDEWFRLDNVCVRDPHRDDVRMFDQPAPWQLQEHR